MSNILQVTLKLVDGMFVLDVDDHGGQNGVYRKPDKQPITWQLSGNLADGTFLALADNVPPGFKWIDQPPAGVFSDFTYAARNKITIQDLHTNDISKGQWRYQLAVLSQGKNYLTDTRAIATTKDPIIVNH